MKLTVFSMCLAGMTALLLAGCGSSTTENTSANADGQSDMVRTSVKNQAADAHAGHHHADEQLPDGLNAEELFAMVDVYVFNESGELVGPVTAQKVVKTDAQWKAQLTDEQYRITRRAGTEPAFCGTLLDNKKQGVYACVCCQLPLFSSDSKFTSGTGWPSFFKPIAPGNVSERLDTAYGMVRTEINCARCDAHLGHVFNDGPKPTGMRFCLNSESLIFTENGKLASLADPAAKDAPVAEETVAKDE